MCLQKLDGDTKGFFSGRYRILTTTLLSSVSRETRVSAQLEHHRRGGAALSVRAVTGVPIKFAGSGEKIDDLEPFYPDRMANRILGMGDMLSLIEKAEKQLDEKKAAEMAEKLRRNKLDFNDMLSQLEQVKKMGSLKQLMSMLPGVGRQVKDVDIDDRQLLRVEAIIQSMTPAEREKPELINPSRKRRIAAGSGMKVEDVNRLLHQLEATRKMMKGMTSKKSSGGILQGLNFKEIPLF